MHPGRILIALAIVLLFVTSTGFTTSVVAVPRPDGCKRVVTTGPALIGHHCRGARRVARVDNRSVVHNPHRANRYPRFERPLERLLTRGDGRIKANGDKAGLRELREKNRRGNGASKRNG